jgi:1,4-dihydroxy-2-naphthoyl-CoA hydrolase
MPDQPDAPAQPGDSHTDLTPSPDGDYAPAFNARRDGWNFAMGIRLVRANADEVTADLEIDDRHRQAYGIVHGGVYSGLVETVSSVAAALWARRHQQSVVGVENHTSFLNAVREGKLFATARPLMRGRRTQVWEATVTDSAGRMVAQGKVRLISLEAGASLAGEQAKVKPSGA